MDDMSVSELKKLAARERKRYGLRSAKAVVRGRRMTRKNVMRAKNLQDQYLFLKALVVTVQTINVLLVCFMGVFAFFELRTDTESSFYATQLSIELTLLLIVLAIVAVENMMLRVLMILGFIAAFSLNVLQVLYFMLFDKNSRKCTNIELPFGHFLCISSVIPLQHHSSFVSGILALFHFVLIILAIAVAISYQGTFSEIVNNTDPSYLLDYTSHMRRHRHRRRTSRRREHARKPDRERRVKQRVTPSKSPVVGSSQQSSRAVIERREKIRSPRLSRYSRLDITKLPDGSRFKTTDNKSFNMEYYVEDGVFVGSGTETVKKAITICAPIRPQRRDEKSQQDSSPDCSSENTNNIIPNRKV
ncbi:hypothetical protein RB195_010081 [Necator americanus]|uniref:Uncharacterized protein n=1 Tax=Necator americanus TaxID=51031 RepID=A0ABR1CXI8_NECAM